MFDLTFFTQTQRLFSAVRHLGFLLLHLWPSRIGSMPMKTFLIALLALLSTASATRDTTVMPHPPESIGSAAEQAEDFVRGGVNAFDHLSPVQRADVRACGLVEDVTSGIRAAVKSAVAGGAGRVVLPNGCYRTSGSIRLPSNMELVGASMHGTKIMPAGDFPAIVAAGSYAQGLTGVGVQNMSVVCAGMAHANAMGVKLVYVNRGKLKDLYFNGCHHGLDLYDQWQTRIDNVTADGLGSDQNQVGVYMGGPTDPANKAPNNAVVMSNSTMQNVALYGYQLVFFAGSKFFNTEAMNGVTGWKLCGEPYLIVGQACQFGHFDNIVADTTSGPGILVDQGRNANPVNNVMFDNVWIGSSATHGLYLAGVTFSQFDNIHITRADNGVYLHNSNNVKVSANVAQYNQQDNGAHAAVISGGADNTLWATNSQSSHPTGYNGITEIGSAHGNSIWGGLARCNSELWFGEGGEARKGGAGYAAQSCQYEVQGRQVRMIFRFGVSEAKSSSSAAVAASLPFPADASALANGAVGGILAEAMNGLGGTLVARPVPGTAFARFFSQGPTGSVALTRGNFSTSSKLSGSLEYVKK